MSSQRFPRHYAYQYRRAGLHGEELLEVVERDVPEELRQQVLYLVEYYLPMQARHAEVAYRLKHSISPADRVEALRRRAHGRSR